jgi:hypothetical protein
MAHSTLAQTRAELDILDQRWSTYWADREAGLVWRNVDRGILRVVGGEGSANADLATYGNTRVRPSSAYKPTESHDQIKYNPWSPYFGVTSQSASHNSDYNEGYGIDTNTAYIGADTMVGRQGLGGVLFSYANGKANIDGGGHVDNTAYRLTAYGSYFLDSGVIVQANFGLGYQDYDTRRAPFGVPYLDWSIWQMVMLPAWPAGEATGHSMSFSLASGKSWYLSVAKNIKFDLLARVMYDDVTIGGFTETYLCAVPADRDTTETIAAQSVTSFRGKLQASVGKEIISAAGSLWTFKARLSWEHQLNGTQMPIDTTIVDNSNQKSVPGGQFTVYGPESPPDVVSVGFSAQIVTLDLLSIGVHLYHEFAREYKDTRIGFTLGKRF